MAMSSKLLQGTVLPVAEVVKTHREAVHAIAGRFACVKRDMNIIPSRHQLAQNLIHRAKKLKLNLLGRFLCALRAPFKSH